MSDFETAVGEDASSIALETFARNTTSSRMSSSYMRRLEAVNFARASGALQGVRPTPADFEHEGRFIEGEIDLATYVSSPLVSDRRTPAPSARAKFEYTYPSRRIVELEMDPVRGKFNAAHLREIHRRIIQDLPCQGMPEVMPGKYRPSVPEGKGWIEKART